jgi:hypothetical protein
LKKDQVEEEEKEEIKKSFMSEKKFIAPKFVSAGFE